MSVLWAECLNSPQIRYVESLTPNVTIFADIEDHFW